MLSVIAQAHERRLGLNSDKEVNRMNCRSSDGCSDTAINRAAIIIGLS